MAIRAGEAISERLRKEFERPSKASSISKMVSMRFLVIPGTIELGGENVDRELAAQTSERPADHHESERALLTLFTTYLGLKSAPDIAMTGSPPCLQWLKTRHPHQ